MINLRAALMDDLDTVCKIVRDAVRKMNDDGIRQWDEIYPDKDVLQEDITRKHMMLAESGKIPAGFIVLNEDQPAEYESADWKFSGKIIVVHRLTVHPDFQRQGIASELMEFAENSAIITDYAAIRLDAFTQNPAAVHLYESRGYRNAGTVNFRKGDFFCFEKKLSMDFYRDEA